MYSLYAIVQDFSLCVSCAGHGLFILKGESEITSDGGDSVLQRRHRGHGEAIVAAEKATVIQGA